jgi:autotransporter-associated beta strand protein
VRAITINGGTFRYRTGSLQIANNSLTLAAGATADVFGTTQGNAEDLNGAGTLTNTSGTTGAFTARNGTVTGNITSNLNLTTTGALTLSGANTYSGTTSVNSGTLLANSSATATSSALGGAGAVNVNKTGTLGGSGGVGFTGGTTKTVSVNGGGTVAPGAAAATVGQLTLNANTTFTGTSVSLLGTLLIDLNGATADKLVINGSLDLSSAFDRISFNTLVAPTLSSYQLVTYTGTLGGNTFDTVVGLPSGYMLDYGTVGEIDLVPVPEPGTWAAAFLAAGAIGWGQRRRLRGLVTARVG